MPRITSMSERRGCSVGACQQVQRVLPFGALAGLWRLCTLSRDERNKQFTSEEEVLQRPCCVVRHCAGSRQLPEVACMVLEHRCPVGACRVDPGPGGCQRG